MFCFNFKTLKSINLYGFGVFLFIITSFIATEILAQPLSDETLKRSEVESFDQQRRLENWQIEQSDLFESIPDVFLNVPLISVDQEPTSVIDPCFEIMSVQLLSEEDKKFRWLARYLNSLLEPDNCLSAKAINQIMTEAQNKVISAGYVTSRVVAEAQNLSSGTLNLTLLPGYVSDIRFIENTPSRATYWNALPVRSGDLLNLRDIEQALENFKRVPSVDVNIEIEPSTQEGYSDLVIQWSQQSPWRVNGTFDNYGSESVGVYQAGFTVNYDPYWAWNDLFYLSYTQPLVFDDESGSQSFSAHYSVPFGYWLLSLNGGYSTNYQVVDGDYESYEYSGENSNQSLKLERSLYRDGNNKLSGFISVQARQSENYINDVEILVQRRRSSTLETSINHQFFMDNATINSSVSHKIGLTAFGAITHPDIERGEGVENPQWLTLGTGYRNPFKWFGKNWQVESKITAQLNLTPLISRDWFSIGGAYSVRGFERGLSGESGAYTRNDLTLHMPDKWPQIIMSLDAGSMFEKQKHMLGTSLGVRGSLFGLTYDGSISRSLWSPTVDLSDSFIYRFQISKSF